MREKVRAANQTHSDEGRTRAAATAKELQLLQRTGTSIDALTTQQLTDMRGRIRDEVGVEVAREAKEAGLCPKCTPHAPHVHCLCTLLAPYMHIEDTLHAPSVHPKCTIHAP